MTETVPDSTQSAWRQAFDESTRREQMAEDSSAWYAVTGLLLFIVTIGVSLATMTVWLCSS